MAKKVAAKMKVEAKAVEVQQQRSGNNNFHSFMIQTMNTKTGQQGGVGVQGSVTGIFINVDKKQIPNLEDARNHLQKLFNLSHYQVKCVDITSTDRDIDTADDESVEFEW